MTFPLNFRWNACSICLICLDCKNTYGQNCTCQAREVEWKRKIVDRDYMVAFCHRPITQTGATKQKCALETKFVDWFFANASPHIELSSFQNNVNICQSCISRYNGNRIKNKGILYIIFIVSIYRILLIYLFLKYIAPNKVMKNKQVTQNTITNVIDLTVAVSTPSISNPSSDVLVLPTTFREPELCKY